MQFRSRQFRSPQSWAPLLALATLYLGFLTVAGRSFELAALEARASAAPAPGEARGTAAPLSPGAPALGAAALGAPAAASATIRGRVVDAVGAPLARARVRLLSAPSALADSLAGDALASSLTGPDGIFVLAPQSVERLFDIVVERAGFAPEHLPARRAGDVLEVRLGAPARLSGRLTAVDGRALEAASVRLVRTWAAGGHCREASRSESDGAGRYAFDNLSAGRYLVEVRADGQAPWVFGADVPSGERVLRDVILPASRRIAGLVLDDDEHPVAGARILAVAEAPSDAITSTGGAEEHLTRASELAQLALGLPLARSAEQGTFELYVPETFAARAVRVVAPNGVAETVALPRPRAESAARARAAEEGEPEVLVILPRRRFGSTQSAEPREAATARAPAPRDDRSGEEDAATSICGYVVDVRGQPVAGAGIVARDTATPEARSRLSLSDESGAFCLANVDVEGIFALWITPPACANSTPAVHPVGLAGVRPGAAEALEIVLPPAVLTTGRVVDASGSAVAGARVWARSATEAVWTHETTDGDGLFRLALPAGCRVDLGLEALPGRPLRAVPAGARGLELVTEEPRGTRAVTEPPSHRENPERE